MVQFENAKSALKLCTATLSIDTPSCNNKTIWAKARQLLFHKGLYPPPPEKMSHGSRIITPPPLPPHTLALPAPNPQATTNQSNTHPKIHTKPSWESRFTQPTPPPPQKIQVTQTQHAHHLGGPNPRGRKEEGLDVRVPSMGSYMFLLGPDELQGKSGILQHKGGGRHTKKHQG